jgi:tetratricopeptide (TPR) repeat protein
VRRIAVFGAVVVGVVAIAIAGFNLNGGTGVPAINGTPAPEAAASPGVDTAKVAELMTKITADPKDTVSLQSLADIYYGAGDYENASGFLQKIVAVDPKNVTALIALGAAQFNLGKADGAEEQWRAVLAIEPDNLEAHYDLGFMYLSLNPPDLANVRLEWGKVMTIAPDSDVAKTVATHLASLDASPAPSAASVGASGGPSTAPSAAPSPTPAASPAPSGK